MREYLPAALHNVAFYFSYSAQAGTGDKTSLRLHLWFYLDKPAGSGRLKAYFEPLAKDLENRYGKILDTGLYNAIQVHYVAAPIFMVPSHDPFAGNKRATDW